MKYTALLLFSATAFLFGCIQKHDGIDRSNKGNGTEEDAPIVIVPRVREDSLLAVAKVKSRKITKSYELVEYDIEYFDEQGLCMKRLGHYEGDYYNGDYISEYSFDENDSLILEKYIDPDGSTTERHYIFENGMMTFRVFVNKSNERDTVKYLYNDLGQRTEMLEKGWRTNYSYNDDGLLILIMTKELGDDTDLETMTELYMYNNKGWRISGTATSSSIGGQTKEWEYDDEGRVLILTAKYAIGVHHLVEYSYNEYGLISKMAWTKSASDYVPERTIVTSYEYEYYSN